MEKNFPSLQAFRDYMTMTLGMEVIWQPQYDTALYPTAGQASLAFFSTPQGQGLSAQQGNANQVKSLADTNMVLGGQLQRGQAFWIDSIAVDFQAGSVSTANTFTPVAPVVTAAAVAASINAGMTDVAAVLNSGALQLTLGTKPYLQDAPLAKFPPSYHLALDTAIGSDSDGAATLLAGRAYSDGMLYKVQPGLTIVDGQSFNVQALWPAVVATPSGFNGQMRVQLNGWLARPAQ